MVGAGQALGESQHQRSCLSGNVSMCTPRRVHHARRATEGRRINKGEGVRKPQSGPKYTSASDGPKLEGVGIGNRNKKETY